MIKQSSTETNQLPAGEEDPESLKRQLSALRDQNAELEQQLSHVSAECSNARALYNEISRSFAWRMTRPLRKALDKAKLVVRKNPRLHRILRRLKHGSAADTASAIPSDVKFSILVPLYNTPEACLREMINSVRAQTYPNWELCLADGSDAEHAKVRQICESYAKSDTRIKYRKLEKNLGISENTNQCAGMATGSYIALLDHDDLLAPDALEANARVIAVNHADVLYSDEDHLSTGKKHVNPFFKPDWSPDLLYSQMYICHFLVFRKALFEMIGGFRSDFNGAQDYDLMLRLSEETERIHHIPRILYTWRESDNSTAANASSKPYAHEAGRKALEAHLKRKFGDFAHADDGKWTFTYDARFALRGESLVSIIIPMKDKASLTNDCVESILSKTEYTNYEILILDNRSEQDETFRWFEQIQKRDARIRVIRADMEFNWSKLNNFGIDQAKGDVYVFLNNDTLVISPDWLRRMSENAMRDDIGVVGSQLLYEDGTIQHAGVVIGFGGWADHVFKGMEPVHYGAPFVSPVLSRNVLAVTGACMCISKKTIQRIGRFDETFIICGSDVEICVRAYECGLNNLYDAYVRLFHLESKSRDSFIPEIDFVMSRKTYAPYRDNNDPYYNPNLDLSSVQPLQRTEPVVVNTIRPWRSDRTSISLSEERGDASSAAMIPPEYRIAEIEPLRARKDSVTGGVRINLLTPSVDKKHVFGGISTAVRFFMEVVSKGGYDARIITTDASVEKKSMIDLSGYTLVSPGKDPVQKYQIVSFADRHGKTIPVRKNDIFIATGWWTAYNIRKVIEWQSEAYNIPGNPLIYMIQDYEPGFYAWSSRYVQADSTYRMSIPTWGVFNSTLLKAFFDEGHYSFAKSWCFDPMLNKELAKLLPAASQKTPRKKQIIVYGRPGTDRNAFQLLLAGLQEWAEKCPDAAEWSVLSAGENHPNISLGNGVTLRSMGKLTLQKYAGTMLETYAGVSLMVSPHPSYPPLEMATFGIKTITNCYANKDLSGFSRNITSLKSCSSSDIAKALSAITSGFDGTGTTERDARYVERENEFDEIPEKVASEINRIFRGNAG